MPNNISITEKGGYVIGQVSPNGKKAYIDTIKVDNGQRGSGIGSRLIISFEEKAMAEGVDDIEAIMTPEEGHGDNLRRFYEKNGFEVTGIDEMPIVKKKLR